MGINQWCRHPNSRLVADIVVAGHNMKRGDELSKDRPEATDCGAIVRSRRYWMHHVAEMNDEIWIEHIELRDDSARASIGELVGSPGGGAPVVVWINVSVG